MTSALWAELEAAGGVAGDYHGLKLMRHFGDPSREYAAATEGAAVFDRGHRTRLSVSGRAPWQMLNGILTGREPRGPIEVGEGVWGGDATYHTVLTAKGRMLTDLWAWRWAEGDTSEVLLDVPVAGTDALLAHFRRFLPPRFAKVDDVSGSSAMITVAGPRAAEAVSKLALGLRVEAPDVSALAEGGWRAVGIPFADARVVTRTADIWPEALSVLGAPDAVRALWHALLAEGALPAGLGVWSTLRVEAGRPAYGTDMDDRTIPVEAGVHDRAIDYQKGCYTGQEVIVRIRDRGHVNRHLRRLMLGDRPTPAKNAELLAADGSGKAVGYITSAVQSPRFEQTVALAYVRRGVEAVLLDGREIPVGTE